MKSIDLVAFSDLAELIVIDTELDRVTGAAIPNVSDEASNLVCATNAGCAHVNAACSANVVC